MEMVDGKDDVGVAHANIVEMLKNDHH